MRRLASVLLVFVVALPSGAQVIRRGSLGQAPPAAWVSGGAGLTEAWTVTDGTTGSVWEFGSATQFTASLEKAYSGATLGLRGTTSLVPLRYTGPDASGVPTSTQADANVSQLFVSAHAGGGRGFHSVLELDLGGTRYSNFREQRTGARLGPSSDTDFSLAFGYGAGFGFSNSFAVDVVRDYGKSWHQRTGLDASADASATLQDWRVVGRFGLGSRR